MKICLKKGILRQEDAESKNRAREFLMSIITKSNYKKQLPALDPFYQKSVDLYCYLCTDSGKPGPTKRRKSLYQLTYHFSYTHLGEREEEWQRLVNNLYELIKKGVIR